jgi:hypothetical protein
MFPVNELTAKEIIKKSYRSNIIRSDCIYLFRVLEVTQLPHAPDPNSVPDTEIAMDPACFVHIMQG